MSEDRCQVQTLDGTEACPNEPRFTLTFTPARAFAQPKTVTTCAECGFTWLDRLTGEGHMVEVRPALRRVLRTLRA